MFSACGIATGGPKGQVAFTSAGEFSWTVPAGVFKLSAVAVGAGEAGYPNNDVYGGDGGIGGSLRYIADLPVTPGDVISGYVSQTAAGLGYTNVKRNADVILLAKAGWAPGVIQTSLGAGQFGGTVGGGEGGYGGLVAAAAGGGGGGAAGYSGNGGGGVGYTRTIADAGTGGGGGGGGRNQGGHGGGGVGLLGQGANGVSGGSNSGGGGGSGGATAVTGTAFNATAGGLYGGGGGGQEAATGSAALGGQGAVRIIWGEGRAYPATLTGDM